jgi:lipopolysaccharide export LptBFGC system permease protein LptF
MEEDIAEVVAKAQRKTQEVEERKELQRKTRLAKQRVKKIKAQRELQEKLIAPFLLIATVVISVLVMWRAR